jgi:hypothetical protein
VSSHDPYRPPRSAELEAGGAEAVARRTRLERLRRFSTLVAVGGLLGCLNWLTSQIELLVLLRSPDPATEILLRMAGGLFWLAGIIAVTAGSVSIARAATGAWSALGYFAAVLTISPVPGGLLTLAMDVSPATEVAVRWLPYLAWVAIVILLEWQSRHLSFRRRLANRACWVLLSLVLLSKGIETVAVALAFPMTWSRGLLVVTKIAFLASVVVTGFEVRRQIATLLRTGALSSS